MTMAMARRDTTTMMTSTDVEINDDDTASSEAAPDGVNTQVFGGDCPGPRVLFVDDADGGNHCLQGVSRGRRQANN